MNIFAKEKELNRFSPTAEDLDVFEALESKWLESSVLDFQQLQKPCMIDTNTFEYALEAILLQQQNKSNMNEWAKIGNCSKMLNQLNKTILQPNINTFRGMSYPFTMLRHREGFFEVETVYSVLKWMLTCFCNLIGRSMRCKLGLQSENYVVVERPGWFIKFSISYQDYSTQ